MIRAAAGAFRNLSKAMAASGALDVMLTAPGTDWPLVFFWVGFALAVASLVLYARKARRELAR